MRTPAIPAGAIVVGVDGSAPSEQAVVWATEVAARENRPLVLVHAAHVAGPWLAGAEVDLAALNQETIRSGQHLVGRTKDGVEAGDRAVTVSGVCVADDARDLLIDLSRHAHLVVLGSRGRGRVRSLVLGSVSSAVVRKAHCPVVVVRQPPDPLADRGVVVGADGSERSIPVLDLAFRAASWRGERLTVVHCFWEAMVADGLALAAPVHSDYAAERLAVSESLAGLRETYPDVEVNLELARGSAEDVLADLTHSASLVVVGSQGHAALNDFILGSVAAALLEHAHCPVAVVPHHRRA